MRIRRLLLGLAILALASGLTIYIATSFQDTRMSSEGSSSSFGVPGQGFTYSGGTLTPDNPPLVTVGSTGVMDLMILKVPFQDLNGYVCRHLAGWTYGCSNFGVSYFNRTILDSYLQTYRPVVPFSETIVNQNVTLNYPVSSPTNVTIVLDQLSSGQNRVYLQWLTTSKTLSYPLLGYMEHASGIATLPNIALMIMGSGAATIAAVLIRDRSKARQPPIPTPHGLAKCPSCGAENLSFAEKCGHCGRPLSRKITSVPAVTA